MAREAAPYGRRARRSETQRVQGGSHSRSIGIGFNRTHATASSQSRAGSPDRRLTSWMKAAASARSDADSGLALGQHLFNAVDLDQQSLCYLGRHPARLVIVSDLTRIGAMLCAITLRQVEEGKP